MATDSKMIAGYVILGVGGFLILVAIILVIVLMYRRRKLKSRPYSPDTFKVVYKMPMANGASTKVIGDAYDGKSVHTITGSEPGYTYVPPPQPVLGPPSPPMIVQAPPASIISQSPTIVTQPSQYITQPVMVRSPPVVAPNPVPRAISMDQLNYPSYTTLPRAGNRYVYPAGTTSRVLIPISKKKAKRMQKRATPKPLYLPVYSSNVSNARSVMSVPAYATSARSVRSTRSVTSGTGHKNKYYMYGSTPNLHATHFTQPVLMYDGKKRYFYADEVNAGRNEHVQNWLRSDHPAEDHVERPASRASSAPTDADITSLNNQPPLTLRWSPSMRRRLEEKDRRERSRSQTQSLSLQVPPPSPGRYQPVHQYTELSETF